MRNLFRDHNGHWPGLTVSLQILWARLLHWWAGPPAVAQYIQTVLHPLPLLYAFGARIGRGTKIAPGIVIHGAEHGFSNLVTGEDCHIGRQVFLDLRDRIILGDKVIVAMRSMILTHLNVDVNPMARHGFPPSHAPVVIGEGSVVFANVTILKGVKIGDHCVIGAGAIVHRDVPPWSVAAGNPCRVIRAIPPEERDAPAAPNQNPA